MKYDPDLSTFPKWLRVLDSGEMVERNVIEYEPMDAIRVANNSINYRTYRSDEADYWQLPSEFALSGEGDCEDFAIAKMAYIIGHGIYDCELVICYIKRTKEIHCVLRVFLDKPWILDNRHKDLLTNEAFNDIYSPIFALSLEGWRRCAE